MALREGAPRPYGRCPFQAPALARSCHPVLDHGTARRLHDAGPDGPTGGQVDVVGHPAPVGVAARADVGARLPDRSPALPCRQERSPSAHARAHPAAEYLRQRLLPPPRSRLGAFPAPGVGRAPEGAHDGPDVQHTRHPPPLPAELGRQAPQAEGAIKQADHGCAGLGMAALGVGLEACHHRLLRPHQARETADWLGAWRIVPDGCPRPAGARRFRSTQACRQRCGSAGLGLAGRADPDQRCLLLWSRRARAQRRLERDRRRRDQRDPLPAKLTTRSAPAVSSGGPGRCAEQPSSSAGASGATALKTRSASSQAQSGANQPARSWTGCSTANRGIHACRTYESPRAGRLTGASSGKSQAPRACGRRSEPPPTCRRASHRPALAACAPVAGPRRQRA